MQSNSDKKLAAAFQDLESTICDMNTMALIAERLIDDLFSNKDLHRRLTGHDEHFVIGGDEQEALVFSVHHLRDMMMAFKKQWYATIEANRPQRLPDSEAA